MGARRRLMILGLAVVVSWAGSFAGAGWRGTTARAIAPGDAAVIGASALNVRQTPDLAGPIVTSLPSGAAVVVVSGPVLAGGYEWFNVAQGDVRLGWVVGAFLMPGSGMGADQLAWGWGYGDRVSVTASQLNVRAVPAADGAIIGTYAYGVAATVTGDATSVGGIVWYPLDNTGWVAGQYLTGATLAPAAGSGTPAPAPTGGVRTYGDVVSVTADLLNVRSLPAATADILTVYPSGRVATVTGDPMAVDGVTWVPLDHLGWVSGAWLTAAPAGAAPAGTPPVAAAVTGGPFAYGDTVVTTERLNVRELSGTGADVLEIYPVGQVARVTGEAHDVDGVSWYPLDLTGWVDGRYLRRGDPGTAAPAPDGSTASSRGASARPVRRSASASVSGSASASSVADDADASASARTARASTRPSPGAVSSGDDDQSVRSSARSSSPSEQASAALAG